MTTGEAPRRRPAYTRVLVAVPVLVAVAGLAVWGINDAAVTSARAECQEPEQPDAAGSTAPFELLTNRGRPTLTLPLADRNTTSDWIVFQSKDRMPIGPAISAIFIDEPRRGNEKIEATLEAKAEPITGGTLVRLDVCVRRDRRLTAGAYQGTVRIYGPQVNDFDYAVVITEKWPWQIALALLAAAAGAFILVAYATESLTFGTMEKPWIASLFGAAVAIAAMVPTFFGTYWNNPTWGSDPGAHIAGLVTAGFTAALGGLALAKRLLRGEQPSSHVESKNRA